MLFSIAMSLRIPFLAIFWLSGFYALECSAEPPAPEKRPRKEQSVESKNRLSKEKSPYLLQHKDNPIHWFSWGDEAFEAARRENKPVFLSIGYSTCYWCHVMEKDSFEQEEVAALLNKHFISIKVDREERPDVDSIYMAAVVATTGHGGWPMSVFLSPRGEPFFGGTYFPRQHFMQLLTRISEIWEKDSNEVIESAKKLAAALRDEPSTSSEEKLTDEILKRAFSQFQSSFDSRFGGFSRAPKFPPSMSIMLLLRLHRRSGNKDALNMAVKTLDSMARGGLYDHLGGGFHRYSTDEHWLVPHFEKMLYDNAQLALAYLEAYQLTKNDMYLSVSRETLDYVLRDMTAAEGGFFSAEDAGEVGKEGEFYVWEEKELQTILPEEKEFQAIKDLYGISSQGNFEGKTNILHLQPQAAWSDKAQPAAKRAAEKILAVRTRRERPRRDDKVLTSWNGLMIAAMSKGFEVSGEKRYLDAAIRSADFIHKKLRQEDGKLLRRFRDGEARFSSYLDDYAFLIHGLLGLYRATFDQQWLMWSIELQQILDRDYWDAHSGGYYFTAGDDRTIITRKKEFIDGAEPAGNSISLLNLLQLYDVTFAKDYRTKAEKLLQISTAVVNRYPSAFSAFLIAADYHFDRAKEVVIVGDSSSKETEDFLKFLRGEFLPNSIIAVGKPAALDDTSALAIFRGKKELKNQPTFYVCENGNCQLPTNESSQAKKLVEEFKKLDW